MPKSDVRAAFVRAMDELMANNENIVILDADLGKTCGTYALHGKYPERAFDVGIAEANMASMAAGMTTYGFTPFIFTFSPFATRRICDQVTVSICYADCGVKIFGADPGLSAEMNGGTHMGLEDIGVMRSIANIVIFEAADAVQLVKALPVIAACKSPVYVRYFRKEIEDVFDPATYRFDLFKADKLTEGKDVSIFASGLMVQQSLEAVSLLKGEGIEAELINIHTIKPIDAEAIVSSAQKTGAVVTCENHNIAGGLASAVADVLCESRPTVMRRIGVRDRFGVVGWLPYLLEYFHMTPADIVKAAKDAVANKQ